MKELRDYQKKIVDAVMSSNKNVLVAAPTGSGKTVMITAVIKRYAELKQKCVFLVPAIDLLAQSKRQFEEAGLSVGIIWKNYDDSQKDVDVYLGTRQTMYRRSYFEDWVKDKIVIVDEAHIGLDRQCSDYADAKRMIGLTATPEQTDGASMMTTPAPGNLPGCYDTLIDSCTIESLTEAGYLAKMRLIPYPRTIVQKSTIERYKKQGKADIPDESMSEAILMATPYIDKNIIEKCMKEHEPAIFFFPGVNTCYDFFNAMEPEAAAVSAVITADTPSKERQQIYADVENGKILFLLNCAVLTTGFDLPRIKNLVLARCVLSKNLFYQIIGRALRPFEGKDAIIYDIFNSYGNVKDELQSCIEQPIWKPEGWLKNYKSSFERAIANASEEIQELYKIDSENALRKLVGETQEAYEMVYIDNQDLSEGLDQMQENLVFEETVVEKVIEKQVKAKPEPQQCITMWNGIEFAQKNKITARVLRAMVYRACNASADYKKYAMVQIMLGILPDTVPEIWDDPKYSAFIEMVTKYCNFWVCNFDFESKNYQPVRKNAYDMAKAQWDLLLQQPSSWYRDMEIQQCMNIVEQYNKQNQQDLAAFDSLMESWKHDL